MARGTRIAAAALALSAAHAPSPVAASARGTRSPRAEIARARSARAEVVGVVVDARGHGVANATVLATREDADVPVVAAVTDARGRFRLAGLAPGRYWFLGIHGDHPFGMTPAMPVDERLDVSIVLDLAVTSV